MIHPFQGITPKIHPSVFLVESAEIIGDVEIEKDCSVWYHAVVRGDVNYVRIGERTNIQDGCLLHVRHKTGTLLIGREVTIGHGAIVHGCTVGDTCLIGMGAIILDNARINSYTLVAAGAVVRNDMEFPEGVLVAGVPARVIRELAPSERAMIEESAQHYIEYAKTYRTTTS
ncbi:MAG: gamma carbonic anhydrase family protein [Ignavibacteriae bacterium]|nr:gamma carbonic anhydrase family protein [Ignavibacteria bacterium]MBI3364862.1 gamma carbonic anhydrase family protein [Ignavibacteriota bacterium]